MHSYMTSSSITRLSIMWGKLREKYLKIDFSQALCEFLARHYVNRHIGGNDCLNSPRSYGAVYEVLNWCFHSMWITEHAKKITQYYKTFKYKEPNSITVKLVYIKHDRFLLWVYKSPNQVINLYNTFFY